MDITKETNDKINGMVKKLFKAHKKLEENMKNLQTQDDEVYKQIDQHYDELVVKLMKQKSEVKQKVRKVITLKKTALEANCNKVELAQMELEGIKSKNDSLETASIDSVSYAKQKKLINEWFAKFESSHEQDLQPIEMDKVEFFPSAFDLPDFYHLSVGNLSVNSDHEIVLPECVYTNKIAKAVLFKGSTVVKQVSIQLETSKGEVTTADVQDNQDGSYSVSFVSKHPGKAKLIVSLDGKEVEGSPYIIEVYRNYEALNTPDSVIRGIDFISKPQNIAHSLHGMWAVVDQDQVYIFDGQNQLVKKIKKYTANAVMLRECRGIAFDADNYLYVTGNGCVKKFDMHGNCLLQFKGSDSDEDQLQDPRGIAIHDGKVYIADTKGSNTHFRKGNVLTVQYKRGNVSTFQCDGQFCASFGSDKLQSAYDVAVNADNNLLVADYSASRIHIYTLDGQHVSIMSSKIPGKDSLQSPNSYEFDRSLRRPNSLATDRNGFLFVADCFNRVIVFDRHGNFVQCFADSRQDGESRVQTNNCYTVSVNHDGYVYVLDNLSKAVQIFHKY